MVIDNKSAKRVEQQPDKVPRDFEKFLKKQKDGEMTVDECCKALGISKSAWYAMIRIGPGKANRLHEGIRFIIY